MGGYKPRKAKKKLEARIKSWEYSLSSGRKDIGVKADEKSFRKPGSHKK